MRQSARRSVAVLGFALLCSPQTATAQTSKSAAVAKELVAAMDAKKLDSIAAKLPSADDQFAAALYFPGVQLLVISGRYSVPQLLGPRLESKDYRETYMELSGTVAPDTKVFVQDMGAPGLTRNKDDNNFYDTWTEGDKPVMFDGEGDKQQLSDAEYAKRFAEADEQYSMILSALLAEAKK
jgi:hypothetical protein